MDVESAARQLDALRREIADIVAMPPETVTSRLRCGRRQLGELLRDYAAIRGQSIPQHLAKQITEEKEPARTSSVRP